MKESLTSRVGRLISGSFNALVDAVENAVPETVMEEAIREIDGAIDDVRAELGRVVANRHLANTRLMEENRKYESLSENIELAVKESRDDLAEAAIAQQLDIEAQIPVLESTIADCSNQEKELESYITALQAKKREMQDELRQYRESANEASATASGGPQSATEKGSNVASKVDKASSTFDRVMEKATGLAASRTNMDGKTAAKVAELEELAHKNRVQERLAAIKSKMNDN
jgi:phage shock protein A